MVLLPTDAEADGTATTLEATRQDTAPGSEVRHGRVVEAEAVTKAPMAPMVTALPIRVRLGQVRPRRQPTAAKRRPATRVVTVPGMPRLAVPSP